jgi:hypothetical protein
VAAVIESLVDPRDANVHSLDSAGFIAIRADYEAARRFNPMRTRGSSRITTQNILNKHTIRIESRANAVF